MSAPDDLARRTPPHTTWVLVLVLVRNGPPSRPEETERYFPPATADSKSHRQEQTRVRSVSACILALFSPPGQRRSVSARTAPRLDQKLCGRHDRPVQSLSLLSLSLFVSRRARPIRPAPSRSLALSRAASLSFSLSSPSLSLSPSRCRTHRGRAGCCVVSATVPLGKRLAAT